MGVLLALLIALLAVPLTIVFSIHRINEAQGYIHFRWLFGLVRFQVRIPQDMATETLGEAEPTPPAKKVAKSSRQRSKKYKANGILGLLQEPGFRRRIYRFIHDLLAATHAENLFIRLRIGLGDPADTGCLWAFIGPIAGMAENFQSVVVRIEPEFMAPLFEVESHGRFRLVPIQFLVLTIMFLLSPTMLQAWLRLSSVAT